MTQPVISSAHGENNRFHDSTEVDPAMIKCAILATQNLEVDHEP